MYQVIYTDYRDSCDYQARPLGKAYDTYEKAYEEMKLDVKEYVETSDIKVGITNDTGNCVLVGNKEYGCQWEIIEVEE